MTPVAQMEEIPNFVTVLILNNISTLAHKASTCAALATQAAAKGERTPGELQQLMDDINILTCGIIRNWNKLPEKTEIREIAKLRSRLHSMEIRRAKRYTSSTYGQDIEGS